MINHLDLRTHPYSWGDVADAFSRVSLSGSFPASLVKIEIYWDQLTLLAEGDSSEEIYNWLQSLFPQRVSGNAIKLDGPPFSGELPFEICPYDATVAGEPPPAIASQFTASSSQIWFKRRPAHAESSDVLLPTFAFHSVKGGVGRTTSAISFAQYLAQSLKRKPLLVDADFEAPGLSYLFLNDSRECHFSFEDLIVLAHADDRADAENTIEFGAQKLSNQIHDGVTYLPCLRRGDMLSSFAIRPEQLQKSRPDRPFFLFYTLSSLAQKAGCDCLLVDLRAGFTDLAAMILCAPGVYPVFVTTPSGQSVISTKEMLDFIARSTTGSARVPNTPAIVINNVIPQVRRSSDFSAIVSDFEECAMRLLPDVQSGGDRGDIMRLSDDEVIGPPIVILDHAPSLTAAPASLNHFVDDLRGQPCFDQLSYGLRRWTSDALESNLLPINAQSVIKFGTAKTTSAEVTEAEIKARRKTLQSFASQRIFAESATENDEDFLVIRALRELRDRFRTELPNATCIGMKGAGKTFTFGLLARMETWGNFIDKITPSTSLRSAQSAMILPVLPAKNLLDSPALLESRRTVAGEFSGYDPIPFSRLSQLVDEASSKLSSESEWGSFWLDALAWSVGLAVGERQAGDKLLERLVNSKEKIVAIFDGLEENFQSFRQSANQQAAIRGLTSSLAQRLLEIPGRPLGQINFVRSDLIYAAYPNNHRQFADRNRAYALTWLDNDILELAGWLAYKSGVADTWCIDFQNEENILIEDRLVPLWGKKLGKADDLAKEGRTREARSSQWVIAALSDLKGRMTARDLVGFVANSAERSVPDTNSLFFDRLLVPRAMTSAIAPVGHQKLTAMAEENPQLGPAIDALRKAPQFAVPLSVDEFIDKIPGKDQNMLRMLDENGIILLEGSSVEMPEIFRTGLGNVVRGTAGRRSIIGLMNKAKKLRISDTAL
jgi:cellulose biosynthesis protein BcsQ